jgi:hypothetical protein
MCETGVSAWAGWTLAPQRGSRRQARHARRSAQCPVARHVTPNALPVPGAKGNPPAPARATGPVPGAPKPNAKLAPVTPSPAGTGAPKTPGAGMPPAAAGQPKPGFSAQAPGRSRPVRSLCENKAQLRRPRRRRPIPQRRRPNRLRQLPSPLRVVGRCDDWPCTPRMVGRPWQPGAGPIDEARTCAGLHFVVWYWHRRALRPQRLRGMPTTDTPITR